MVRLAQLVRASDCGSEGQGFETLISPKVFQSPYTFLASRAIFCVYRSRRYFHGVPLGVGNGTFVIAVAGEPRFA